MKFKNKTKKNGKYKWILLFLMACFLAIFLAVFSYIKNRDQEYQKSAEALLAENKLEQAEIQFKNMLEKDPENEYACLRLSEIYRRLNKPEKMVKILRLAVALNPDNLDAQFRLARAYFGVGWIPKAHEIVNLILIKDPENIPAMRLLASVLVRERNVTAAITTLQGAIEIEPENPGPYTDLGHLFYYGKENFLKSEQAFLKAISLDRSLSEPYEGLSRIYEMEGQTDKLETLLMDWTKTPGNPLQKFVLLAEFYESRDNLKKAEKTYLKLLGNSEKKDPALLHLLAQFYNNTGQFRKAAQYYNEVTTINKDLDIQSELAGVYFEMKSYQEAQRLVTGILDKRPNHARARLTDCKLLRVKKSYNEAVEKLDQLIAIDNTLAEAYYLKALCLVEKDLKPRDGQEIRMAASGDYSMEIWKQKQAIKTLRRAIDLSPDYIEARMKLSDLFVKTRDLILAERQLTYVLDKHPDNRPALLKLGNLKIQTREWTAAEKIFHRLTEIQPGFSPAHEKLGVIFMAVERPGEAIAAFTKALDTDPLNMSALHKLVNSHLMTEKKESALQILTTHLSHPRVTEKEKGYMAFLQGEIALSEGQVDQAKKYFQDAVNTFKEATPAYEALAALEKREGNLLRAASYYQQILSYDPECLAARMSLSRIYQEQDKMPKAMEALENILKIQDNHAPAANDLAYLLAGEGRQMQKALHLALTALSQEPDNPDYLDTLGWVYHKQEDYDMAVYKLRESLDINPHSVDSNYHLGLAYFELTKFEEAREHLRLALGMDPDFPGSEKAKGLLGE